MVDAQHALGETEPLTRSLRKRNAILHAAATTFLRHGYLGTSMDEIAALAGVSKQTVYKHFADKERLFVEIVTSIEDEILNPVYAEIMSLQDSGDLERNLRDLAGKLLARVLQPRLLQLRRLVIGEAVRFPELGRTFYERGPGRAIDGLSTTYARLAERGALRAEDPALAASHFNWLIMSAPINRAMFLGDDTPPVPAELDRYADGAVRVFRAAYGPR